MRSLYFLPMLFLAVCGTAAAAQLSVSPVLIDLEAPTQASVLNLSNDGESPITVQTRVFQWVQNAGREDLKNTLSVIASPPIVTLAPRQTYTVRLVRVSKEPMLGEESYRVLIDELPDPSRPQANGVSVLVRQSIPVFMSGSSAGPPDVSWALQNVEGELYLAAVNRGNTRLRLANASLHDPDGTVLSLGKGLIGYVLAQSTMRWPIGQKQGEFGVFGGVALTAQTQSGTIDAPVAAPN